jgi:hypothetical protein
VKKTGAAYASNTVDGEIANPQDQNRATSEDQPTKAVRGRLPKQQKDLMKTASIDGIILIGVGIVSLACLTSPIRLMFQETIGQHKINAVPPILGGLALVGGIALLFAVRPRADKEKKKL